MSGLFDRLKQSSFRSRKNGMMSGGVCFPDGRRMPICHEEGLTVQVSLTMVISKACVHFRDYHIPPCARPFLSLCPEDSITNCLSPYHVLSQEDSQRSYHLRVMSFIKETHRHLTRLDHDVGATRFYFDQVRQDFLSGRLAKLETKDCISGAFMMAALDVWKWSIQEDILDPAVILKKVKLNLFLPQAVRDRVPKPKECLEHYFRLLQSRWRPEQVMSQPKCMQNYLRLFEENMRPDIHKFTVKVSQDGSSEQDQTVQVELSAYSGIKIKRANQQYFTDLCPLTSLHYIEAISSRTMVRVAYGNGNSQRETQALTFFTVAEMASFCTVVNSLHMLVVDANKCLLEGSLKPSDEQLRLSPGDPVMAEICHQQICRDGADDFLIRQEVGSYLVRQSRSEDNRYDLCVLGERGIKTVRVMQTGPGEFHVTDKQHFPSLTQLIRHYNHHRGMPAPLAMNFSPNSMTTPIPIISSKEWEFEPPAAPGGAEVPGPPSPINVGWQWGDLERRESSCTSDNSPFLYDVEEHTLRPMEPSEISFVCIDMGPTIGEGHFSKVHKGTYTPESGEPPISVAIKELKDSSGEHALMMEARNMSRLEHLHIVQFYGFCRHGQHLMLVTEFVSGGDLRHLLRRSSRDRPPLTQATQLRYASQVASGMGYLAEQKIVHRDLAARNVLVSVNDVVKITDFGLARRVELDKPYYRMCVATGQSIALPLMWYAPECLSDFKFTSRSDIWSYGVLLWEIFSLGEDPFYHCHPSNEKICEALLQDQRLPQPQGCPDAIYEIMQSCWNINPNERPDFIRLELFTQRRSEDD